MKFIWIWHVAIKDCLIVSYNCSYSYKLTPNLNSNFRALHECSKTSYIAIYSQADNRVLQILFVFLPDQCEIASSTPDTINIAIADTSFYSTALTSYFNRLQQITIY